MTTDEIMNRSYDDEMKAIDVAIQDQTTEIIDLYMVNLDDAVEPTVTATADIDDKMIEVDATTGITAGDAINISENGRTFQAIVSTFDATSITFNAPLDMPVTADAVVQVGKWNMVVDGSTAPKIYRVTPPVGATWDIVRLTIGMTATTAMDDSTFGPLTALTNGVVLRVVNGQTKNIFVVSDNGGLAERCYDATYPAKVPAGIYAFRAIRTFGGQDKNGVVVRLQEGDSLEFIIQDDLSDATFTKFACVVQGHAVQE